MKHISGYFSLTDGHITDLSQASFSYEDNQVLIRLLGHLGESVEATEPGPAIADRFRSFGDDVTGHLSGVYLLLVYDKKKTALHIFHGMSTYPQALYYTVDKDTLYYSTSLKFVLKLSGIQRDFDRNGLREFLLNGYVIGSKTLVENVSKIEPFRSLAAEAGAVRQIPARYSVPELSEEEAAGSWTPVLDRAIRQSFSGEPEINMSISSGYDSSYIMYVASQSGKPVNAFSLGGRAGYDELPLVEKNVSVYKNVSLFSKYTERDTLHSFPDIVWRLEGAAYERGIFLQYDLAKMMSNARKEYMVCGEGADQIMNLWYLEMDRAGLHDTCKVLHHWEYPYLYLNLMVMKKSGILANSFGIDTRYPYHDDEFVSVAKALRRLNGTKKQFHIKKCGEVFAPEILANISKKGGATDCHSLFDSDKEIAQFKSVVKKSGFYGKYASLLRGCSEASYGKDFVVKLLYAVSKTVGVDFAHISDIAYYRNEVALREYVGYAYLILFEILFLSGKYDSLFGQDGIDLDLTAVL